jgi:hypothetical protein
MSAASAALAALSDETAAVTNSSFFMETFPVYLRKPYMAAQR